MSNYVNLLDIVYPVGSVFISNNSVSPADFIGGIWAQLDSDTFICGGTPGATGGANEGKLSIANLPSNVWVTGGTCDLFGLPKALNFLAPGNGVYGFEASRIVNDQDEQYSYKPFDNRPKYRAFNIYFRTA